MIRVRPCLLVLVVPFAIGCAGDHPGKAEDADHLIYVGQGWEEAVMRVGASRLGVADASEMDVAPTPGHPPREGRYAELFEVWVAKGWGLMVRRTGDRVGSMELVENADKAKSFRKDHPVQRYRLPRK